MRLQLMTTDYEGVLWRPDGQLVVRASKKDPKTGHRREQAPIVPRPAGMNDRDYLLYAVVKRAELLLEFDRTDAESDPTIWRFKDYAPYRIQLRKDRGDITSNATPKRYDTDLVHINERFGDTFLDKITRSDVERWMGDNGKLVNAGKYTPHTVNGWWSLFKGLMADAAIEFNIANPCERIKGISLTLHETYGDPDEPNSLEPDELEDFMGAARIVAPRYYAFLLLGTITGRRACELRPLRAKGRDADLNWGKSRLMVRRSQTYGEPNARTKQKRHVMAYLNKALLGIMEWHLDHLTPNRKESELLFPPMRPGEGDGFMARSALAKILPAICKEAKIKKHITPRFMRRTYQDWCRAANVNTKVQKAMSGHATDEMKDWYSTMGEQEGRTALDNMCAIARIK